MRNVNSVDDAAFDSNSYKEILPNYNSNNQYLLRDGFNQLNIDMGFTQIRFYCFKKERGRVFHIMTNTNASGANVVKYFTNSETQPEACGSFTRLSGDNSTLAINCANWGHPTANRWASGFWIGDKRLYSRPIFWLYDHYFTLSFANRFSCDDKLNDLAMSVGDTWQIFVR